LGGPEGRAGLDLGDTDGRQGGGTPRESEAGEAACCETRSSAQEGLAEWPAKRGTAVDDGVAMLGFNSLFRLLVNVTGVDSSGVQLDDLGHAIS
jgi:hypothetical protein